MENKVLRKDSLEALLVEHSAATLAGIKAASLFTFSLSGEKAGRSLLEEIEKWNRFLKEKGITIAVLRIRENRALLYVYRKELVLRILNCPQKAGFLARYGYQTGNMERCLKRLGKRTEKAFGFPHEIGIFLGYPLEDVRGFIVHKGRHCKCCGCWKVYGDMEEAHRLFAQYRNCRRIYTELFLGGCGVCQLADTAFCEALTQAPKEDPLSPAARQIA